MSIVQTLIWNDLERRVQNLRKFFGFACARLTFQSMRNAGAHSPLLSCLLLNMSTEGLNDAQELPIGA